MALEGDAGDGGCEHFEEHLKCSTLGPYLGGGNPTKVDEPSFPTKGQPVFEEMIQFDSYFSKGLVQPPTSNVLKDLNRRVFS